MNIENGPLLEHQFDTYKRLHSEHGIRNTHYTCNGLDICMIGTTSVPKSVLHYVVDKVRLFVPI